MARHLNRDEPYNDDGLPENAVQNVQKEVPSGSASYAVVNVH